MYFVNEIHLAVALAKFVLRINENKAVFGSDFLTTTEEFLGVVFYHGIVFGTNKSLCNNLFFRDVEVVTFVGLRRWRYDGFWKTFVLLHTVGQFHTAQFPTSFLIFTPSRACKYRTNDHLHTEALAFKADGHHRVGRGQLPIRADVGRKVKKLGRYLVQNLPFKGNAFRQDHVESRYSVGCNHHDFIAVDVVHISNFTVIHTLLSSEVEIGLCQCFHLYPCFYDVSYSFSLFLSVS